MAGHSSYSFVFGVSIFYAILFVFLTAYGYTATTIQGLYSVSPMPPAPSLADILTTLWSYIAQFFSIIFYTISGIPLWINLIIFTPLALTMLWVILELARG
jgi:hypothetical protein